jgi:hypothetical protein
MTNWQEYIAGTDPRDPLSYLRVDQVSATGSVQVEFLAISNRTYTIQFTDGLMSSPWTRLADVAARTSNRVEVVTDPNPNPNRFYRLATPRQP